MEVRLIANAAQPLATKVYYCDEEAFEVASVIVMGKTDASSSTPSGRSRAPIELIAEIIKTGKKLKTIYLTHAHPDHYFGAGVIAQAFPEARIVAIPSEADIMNSQFFGKLEIWENTIGAHNICRVSCHVESLTDDYIELEGQRLEIITKVIGDMAYNTMVWIPCIKTLYASDVLFNQAHPFTCEITAPERQQWIKDIEKIMAMDAEVIIPGHAQARHAVRQELLRVHPRVPRRHRGGAGPHGHRRRLLLRHGRALPRRPSHPSQQRDERQRVQGRPRLALARRGVTFGWPTAPVAASIDEYIAGFPPETQRLLSELRAHHQGDRARPPRSGSATACPRSTWQGGC